jgi:hypothetical protein
MDKGVLQDFAFDHLLARKIFQSLSRTKLPSMKL